ncbi:MAG: hypothetical protein S4CHLAM45_07210 [Chlamydiales bacterium]|nr:hypothetical protein [Chlamydiales bacterium]MCH9620262.1 hypothetical protein [Chlamydiales bacterium]MCH9622828.1 hypothetical protein [Chlamydiales bacterium]
MSYPRILTSLETSSYSEGAVERILSQILPPNALSDGSYQERLPLICWSPLAKPPFNLSFFLFCDFRENAFHYFCEMIRKWLIPGKQLNVLMQFAVDFSMPDISNGYYMAGEVLIRIEAEKELEIIQKNLLPLEAELKIGILSPYQAIRILEIKGLSYDEKTALIQENINKLIKHRPQDFDYDILSEMQTFLVLCKEEFKIVRGYRHMSRIICVLYLFRKALKLSYDAFPQRRYISLKLIRAKLNRTKPVLGIAIALSFLHEDEVFELRHILSAVKTLVPNVQKVEDSYFFSPGRSDPICTLYLEVEKEGGFSLSEERLLKEELPSGLKNRIEKRLNPIFMPQNEEVVMRHIVTLSSQLKYIRDLPQVIIDFSKQTEEKLEFLVVVLRIKGERTLPIKRYFELKSTPLEFISDRRKFVGTIRKKYKKEATVFYLRIPKAPSLRQDHSVDLYKARRELVEGLRRVIGDFRDYNGGTISKETELFGALREKLGSVAEENNFLLENFFYSLNPPVMRSIFPVGSLQKLFAMVLDADIEGVDQTEVYQIRMEEEDKNFYLLVTSVDTSFAPLLTEVIEEFEAAEMASCFLQNTELPCFGIICRNFHPETVRRLWMRVEGTMESHASQKKSSIPL